MGDHWLHRVKAHADSGVGGSSNAVRTKATVRIGIAELGNLSFEGSVLDNSAVPALLGLRTNEALYGRIDTRTNQRYM
eukprot:12898366-Prorocentrum_lima.AAC.1